VDIEGEKTKLASRIISGATLLVLAFYVISMGIVQSQGLNTTGLNKFCVLNPTLLSSKTGYLLDWVNHQQSTVSEGAVAIGRKIALL
jgi:hypothetical protein